jgi:hypothetical protein
MTATRLHPDFLQTITLTAMAHSMFPLFGGYSTRRILVLQTGVYFVLIPPSDEYLMGLVDGPGTTKVQVLLNWCTYRDDYGRITKACWGYESRINTLVVSEATFPDSQEDESK